MTNKQILAVYNLAKNNLVRFISITNFKTDPNVSVILEKETELKEGIELLTGIFPDLILTETHISGQYSNADSNIYLFVGAE